MDNDAERIINAIEERWGCRRGGHSVAEAQKTIGVLLTEVRRLQAMIVNFHEITETEREWNRLHKAEVERRKKEVYALEAALATAAQLFPDLLLEESFPAYLVDDVLLEAGLDPDEVMRAVHEGDEPPRGTK